jgi:hypothetical protein
MLSTKTENKIYTIEELKALLDIELEEITYNKIYEVYWHYDDNLNGSDILPKAFYASLKEKDVSLECFISDYLDSEWGVYYNIYEQLWDCINQVEENNNIELTNLERDELQEHFYYNYQVDLNINQLLRNTDIEEFTIYFGGDWDEDYYNEEGWNELSDLINEDGIDSVNEEKIEEFIGQSQVKWLVETQGYEVKDVFNEEKRKDSEFLTSLFEELFEYITELHGLQLIAKLDEENHNWNEVFELYKNKNKGVISAGATFGLFNTIHGGGSGLNIITEKEIDLSEAKVYEVDPFAGMDSIYGYRPLDVYGDFVGRGKVTIKD